MSKKLRILLTFIPYKDILDKNAVLTLLIERS
jgi:hypothetical protein